MNPWFCLQPLWLNPYMVHQQILCMFSSLHVLTWLVGFNWMQADSVKGFRCTLVPENFLKKQKEAVEVFKRRPQCPKCTFLHVNKLAGELELVSREVEWKRWTTDWATGKNQMKEIVSSQNWAVRSGGVLSSSDGHMQRLGKKDPRPEVQRLIPISLSAQHQVHLAPLLCKCTLCFLEGEENSNSQSDVQITLITHLQAVGFHVWDCRHIGTDRPDRKTDRLDVWADALAGLTAGRLKLT